MWLSGFLIVVGSQSFSVALAVTILDAGGSATTLGLILASRVLSSVLLLLIGGAVADRFPRKLVMITADVFRGILTLFIVFASVAHLGAWVLALIVFVMGAGEALGFPASGAILPSILPPDKLAQGNAWRSVTSRTAAIVGPALGGLMVATLGAHATFIVVAALFFVGTSLLLRINENPLEAQTSSTSMFHEIREGVRFVRSMPWVAWTIPIVAFQLMVVLGFETVLLPVITRREFHTNYVFAWSSAAASLGAVVTAVLGARYKSKRPGLISIISWMFFAAAPISLAYPFAPWFVVACYFIAGLSFEPFGVYWASALQREVPQVMQGRIFSLDQMGSAALLPIGMALAGPVTHMVGERQYLLGSAVVHVALCALMLFVPGVVYFQTRRTSSSISEQGSGSFWQNRRT